MQKGIVTRNNTVWQGHPDVAMFHGKLFVSFRVSDCHLTQGKTQINVTSTEESVSSVWAGHLSFKEPTVISESKDRYNCPRLTVIDDYLYLFCDEVDASNQYVLAENDENKTRVMMWRTLDGEDWEGPTQTNISGIVPDKIVKTQNGFLVATHTGKGRLVQNVWYNENLAKATSWKKFRLCHHKELNLCEASIVKVGHSFMCMMRENSSRGLPSYICWSKDGVTWNDARPTRMFGCHRPVCGILSSGQLLTTYREASHSFKRGYWAKNTFACLSNPDDLTQSIILPLDHDNSAHSDGGYTGWVELSDGAIFIVNYIVNHAVNPYICWYVIRQDEF